MGIEGKETARSGDGNRGGPEVEEWRAKIKGNIRAEARMGTGKERMECQYGR